jgi:hypothetical protein
MLPSLGEETPTWPFVAQSFENMTFHEMVLKKFATSN